MNDTTQFPGEFPDNFPDELRIIAGAFALHQHMLRYVCDQNGQLSMSQRHLMAGLSQPQRMGQLAQKLRCLPSTVTALAAELIEMGLVRREADPVDRRASRLVLTDKGQELRTSSMQAACAEFHRATGLGDADIALLAGPMDRIRQQLESQPLKPEDQTT
jgi:DNA-binding MarR family transcriptional regulator